VQKWGIACQVSVAKSSVIRMKLTKGSPVLSAHQSECPNTEGDFFRHKVPSSRKEGYTRMEVTAIINCVALAVKGISLWSEAITHYSACTELLA
jgi:hypothetical protein